MRAANSILFPRLNRPPPEPSAGKGGRHVCTLNNDKEENMLTRRTLIGVAAGALFGLTAAASQAADWKSQ